MKLTQVAKVIRRGVKFTYYRAPEKKTAPETHKPGSLKAFAAKEQRR